MNILVWHVHGSWLTAFVQGPHRYYIPLVEGRTRDGLGRAQSWTWPDSAIEVTPAEIAMVDLDVIVLQRPRDLELAEGWLGDRFGEVPMVYVEHDTPTDLLEARHPLADRDDLVIAHVTHFNRLMWDTGSTACTVIEHGVIDPGHRYTGE